MTENLCTDEQIDELLRLFLKQTTYCEANNIIPINFICLQMYFFKLMVDQNVISKSDLKHILITSAKYIDEEVGK